MTTTTAPGTDIVEAEIVPSSARAAMIREDTDSWMAVTGGDLRALSVDLCQTDFVPKGLRGKPAAALAAMLFGRELGLPPIASLQSLFSVDGRVGLYAQTMRALIMSAGHEFRIIEMSSARCVMEGRRAGQDEWQRFSFTMQEARDAGLANKSNWKNYSPDMLLARTTGRMAKAIFADVIQGMSAAEELQDLAPSTVTVEQIDMATGEVIEQPKAAAKTRMVQRKKKADSAPAGPEPERARPPLRGGARPAEAPASNPVGNQDPSAEAPVVLSDDDPASEGQVKSIIAHLDGRLGVKDRDDRLYWAGVAAEVANPLDLDSTKTLTRGQAKHAIDRLGKIRDAAGLDDLLPEGATSPLTTHAEGEVQA